MDFGNNKQMSTQNKIAKSINTKEIKDNKSDKGCLNLEINKDTLKLFKKSDFEESSSNSNLERIIANKLNNLKNEFNITKPDTYTENGNENIIDKITLLEKKKEAKSLGISNKNENSENTSCKPPISLSFPLKNNISINEKIKNEVDLQNNNGIKRTFLQTEDKNKNIKKVDTKINSSNILDEFLERKTKSTKANNQNDYNLMTNSKKPNDSFSIKERYENRMKDKIENFGRKFENNFSQEKKNKNNNSFTMQNREKDSENRSLHNSSFNKQNYKNISTNDNSKIKHSKHKSTSANNMIMYINNIEQQKNNEDDYSNFNSKNTYYTPEDYNNKFKDFYSFNSGTMANKNQKSNKNSTNISIISNSNQNTTTKSSKSKNKF